MRKNIIILPTFYYDIQRQLHNIGKEKNDGNLRWSYL